MNNKTEYDKLTCHFKNEDRIPISFKGFNRPLGLIRKIKDGSIDLEKSKENQENLTSNLGETTRRKWELNQKSKKV